MSEQQVWLITGTSSGLGKELALAVLERGHKVIATARARSLPKLAELKGRGAEILELDVVAPLSQLQEVAKKAVGIYGKIDVVVNNAGNVAFGALEENTPEESLDQFNTNLFGGLNVARAFLPHMRPRKTGAIVWIGSLAGYSAGAGLGLYNASKYAVRGISESLHQELAPLGLRSICIEPGYFKTDLLVADNRAPFHSRIPDYESSTRVTHEILAQANQNQLGDARKGGNAIIDIVTDEGLAAGLGFSPTVLLGSDCYRDVRGILAGSIERMDKWKKLSCSTDRDDL